MKNIDVSEMKFPEGVAVVDHGDMTEFYIFEIDNFCRRSVFFSIVNGEQKRTSDFFSLLGRDELIAENVKKARLLFKEIEDEMP